MKLVTSEEMRAIEAEADSRGLTYAEMMRRAGEAVAHTVDEELGGGGSVVILAGPGNNGGDGLVAALELDELGYDVRVYLWQRTMDGDELVGDLARRDVALTRAEDDPRRQTLLDWIEMADAVVDALLGTGARLPLEGDLADVLESAGEAIGYQDRPTVVAVDLSTGLDADTGQVDSRTIPADITVTFGFPKVGHYTFPGASYVGELIHDSIGLVDDDPEGRLFVTTYEQVSAKLKPMPLDAHKGTFGNALVVGGSGTYTGAPFLAAAGAYRAGAGLVTAAIPGSIHTVIASLLPEATFLILPEDLGVISRSAAQVVRDKWSDYDAVLVGPGLTTEKSASECLRLLVRGEEADASTRTSPLGFRVGASGGRASQSDASDDDDDQAQAFRGMVVDADGLNILAETEDLSPRDLPPGSVVTPHPGEMGRLLDMDPEDINADRVATARQAAETWDQVVVLKGAFSVVASPDGRTGICPFANPTLATAGTGDVLAGLIVGFMAQGLEAFDAALVGTFVHGLAAERFANDFGGRGAVAGDLLDMIPGVLSNLVR